MTRLVERLSFFLDIGARMMVAAIIIVISANVIGRIVGAPIRGTVEAVQFLTALAIGLGLAYCAVQGGHVSITFLTDKLPTKVQNVIALLIEGLVACFLALTTWELYQYGNGMKQSGEIALTTGLPFYPLVYVVAVGFAVYLLVVLLELGKILRQLFGQNGGSKPDSDKEAEPKLDEVLST